MTTKGVGQWRIGPCMLVCLGGGGGEGEGINTEPAQLVLSKMKTGGTAEESVSACVSEGGDWIWVNLKKN